MQGLGVVGARGGGGEGGYDQGINSSVHHSGNIGALIDSTKG